VTVLFGEERKLTYDPSKALLNSAIFHEQEAHFGIGDCIQFTAPCREKAVKTRETGTVREFDGREMLVELDNGKSVRFDVRRFRHLDHAYTMTSQAAQSMNVERVIINVECDDRRLKMLHNDVFAYVAVSRASLDAIYYTDNRQQLAQELSRRIDKPTALSREQVIAMSA
jgi:ATP-dependent exoDNAse (exonuclease V) alpha subunit